MTEEEIRGHLNRLHMEKEALDSRVMEAKRIAKSEGFYADVRWLTRAERDAKQRGRQILWLQGELGRVNKEKRSRRAQEDSVIQAERSKVFERAFMVEAKEVLPQELYMLIIERAAERSGQA